MSEFGFPKKLKLQTNQQFKYVLEQRNCVKNDVFTLFFAENNENHPRFGISVGKKYGNAVKRNRLKRIVRECCRLLQHNFPKDYDYILMYSTKMTNNNISNRLGLAEATKSLESLIAYAKRRYKI